MILPLDLPLPDVRTLLLIGGIFLAGAVALVAAILLQGPGRPTQEPGWVLGPSLGSGDGSGDRCDGGGGGSD